MISNGRRVRNRPLPFEKLATVPIALRWLLEIEPLSSDKAVFRQACLHRILRRRRGGDWSCSGSRLLKRVWLASRRLPKRPAELADVLHGLGEMVARAPDRCSTLVSERLRRVCWRVNFQPVLDQAVRRDGAHTWSRNRGGIAFGQWVARAPFDWDSLNSAIWCLGHPGNHAAWRYGLLFTSRLALSMRPEAVDRWLRKQLDNSAVAVIGMAACDMQLPWNELRGARSLLTSATPAFRCIAAAALLESPWRRDGPLSFEECVKALQASEIAPGDIVWAMGWRLKELIHARYRVTDGLKNAAARKHQLEEDPDSSPSGPHNAATHLKIAIAEVERLKPRLAEIEEALERILSNLAAIWPYEGLTPAQLREMSHNFVDTPEVRYRLAMKLSCLSDRDALLQANVTQLRAFLYPSDLSGDPLDGHFHRDESNYSRMETWTARSMVALYADDKKGVGRQTSYLLQALAGQATELAERPYAAGRFSHLWSNVTGRAAFADRFAFAVVAAASCPADVAFLKSAAVDHSFTVLHMSRQEAGHDILFVHLAFAAVHEIAGLEYAEAVRLRWAQADTLPDFARAFAIWTSPSLPDEHADLADCLFRRVMERPLSRSANNTQLSCMVTLLDIALVAATLEKNPVRRQRIVDLWIDGFDPWRSIASQWGAAARLMSIALASEGPERRKLLADDRFRSTAVRRQIETLQTTASDCCS